VAWSTHTETMTAHDLQPHLEVTVDPLMYAMLATHDSRSLQTQDRDDLGWSALPRAPVIADSPSRASVVRQRVTTAPRRVADKVGGRRRVRRIAGSNC
jgi:hypothetical protein